MECYCYLRNIQDLLSDGKTPYAKRFGEPFNTIIPFGSMVEYHPISTKDLSRLHQFGKKVLPRILLYYVFFAGGIWKGDIMVADIEELEKMDASEIHAKRLNTKEVLTQFSGGDQVLRTSTSIRNLPDREEEQGNLQGKSDESFSTHFKTHRCMMKP